MLCVLITLAATAAGAPAYKPADGPYAVRTVEEMTIQDEQRNKDLTARVHYPEGDGPFPVIVFSHGFGVGTAAFAPVSRHWASHGYVTIHPRHEDAGALRREQVRREGSGGEATPGEAAADRPDPALLASRRQRLRERLRRGGFEGGGPAGVNLAERVRDVTAVLDALDQVEVKVPDLKDKLDRERIGISGHSYGACVTMLVGGATVGTGGGARTFADPRVRCILPFSAAGTGEYGLTKGSWEKAGLPALFVTGTRDVRPGHEPSWRREPFELSPPGDKYLLVIKGATHFHFGGGPAGTEAGRYEALVKTASIAFWDAHLKRSGEAKAFLQPDGGGFVRYAGDRAELSAK